VRKATLASILRKSRYGVRLNEHLEHDCGLTVFQHACKMGLGGDCLQEAGVALPFWAFTGVAQVQEPGGSGGEAGSRRGLGQMAGAIVSGCHPHSDAPAVSFLIYRRAGGRCGRPGHRTSITGRESRNESDNERTRRSASFCAATSRPGSARDQACSSSSGRTKVM